MNYKILPLSIMIVIFLTSCGQAAIPAATLPSVASATVSPTPVDTPKAVPTSTSDLDHLDPSAILFEQNFETGEPYGLSTNLEDWTLVTDNYGNHSYCNISSDNYVVATFGTGRWTDYAVELRINEIEKQEDPWVAVYARYTPNINTGYYGALNLQTYIADLALNNPYRNFANQSIPTTINWNTLRLEVADQQIKYYINDQLIGDGTDGSLSKGEIAFGISPHLKVCIDDIRVWALTKTGAIGKAPGKFKPTLEIVTDKTATGDGGNAWGGHQTRIVRTEDGVFTAYTIEGSGYFDRKWQLAWRQEDGSWPVVAQGDAGKDPVNLLVSPDGTLHIIGWPNETGTKWSGKPEDDQVVMTKERIPGVSHSNWPYSSAGINKDGDLCVLSSIGGEGPGGSFKWACLIQSTGKWTAQTTPLDYRYCYTYVFPGPGGQLSLVSTRAVRWEALGYTQPAGAFDYVYNALGYWSTEEITTGLLQQVYFLEENPTSEFPNVFLNAQKDAFQDTEGNMHVLYWLEGASTSGIRESRHVILSPEGEILNDVQLPEDLGGFARIFQDTGGRFYILGSSGLLYPAGEDGVTLGTPIEIDLQGYEVEYSGYGISVPRTGTPISNVLDVVFPSDGGTKWIYFQILLLGE